MSAKITLPSSTARGGWTVNPTAIRNAIEMLGIQRNVIVKLSGARTASAPTATGRKATALP